MSILLADIDSTCSSLGWDDGTKYHMDPDAIQGLKHLIWILKRDAPSTNEYRRYVGQKKVMQTDLIPMLTSNFDHPDVCDVLLRLIVNLTYPALLLYNGNYPNDAVGRRQFMHLVEILQCYKESFATQQAWAALGDRLQKLLLVDYLERGEENDLIVERILTLIRNVLQVPTNAETERRFDNDASIHDQVLWALQQTGLLDLVLYILSSEREQQYHLHALEIMCLAYREQKASSLADASLQRSAAEKHRDELELINARKREKAKRYAFPQAARHSSFCGTYVLQNVKSISDNDVICHQPLQKVLQMEFDTDKQRIKKSFRHVKESGTVERKSAFSVRLFLREFSVEILRSSYNNLVRQIRRLLEQNASHEAGGGHDDSYLLWAIRFFMEFNRFSGFKLDLVSESLSVHCFHWIITRIEHYVEMITSDKTRARLWSRRLHLGVQAYREMLESLQALQKQDDEKAKDLFAMLQNNVFYVLEYREVILHLLINFNEANNTRAYLRDVVETSHTFFKMLEKYCSGTVRVQSKKRAKPIRNKPQKLPATDETANETSEAIWLTIAGDVSTCLVNQITLPEEDQPIPFDAASDVPIDDQKGDCMIRIHSLLQDRKYEHAIVLLRAAREVWTEDDCFGLPSAVPEDELVLLKDLFMANLPKVAEKEPLVDSMTQENVEDYDDEEEEDRPGRLTETDFRFEDFARRLVNPKIVRACTLVLSDWEKIPTSTIKAAVTILHRVAFGCKMPTMLFQASLFRIFQRVFAAPKDDHQLELRRLGVYIIRQFQQLAASNPKIYVELLFYKSIKEANAIELGYDDGPGGFGTGQTKGVWTEEQEEELRRLFMENQANPATDQDVIDWLLDNLIDTTRTRRGVIKKLKELGLIFKAPTKKSTAAASNKNLWQTEQDERLRELYEQHRLEENVLATIVAAYDGSKSKRSIVQRMVTLGLIADKSELKTTKKRQRGGKSSKAGHQESSSSSEDSEAEHDRTTSVVTLNTKRIKSILGELEESMKEAIDWLIEALQETANDYTPPDNLDDSYDGVSLVPMGDNQIEALQNVQFVQLLKALGFTAPGGDRSFWLIPANWSPSDMQRRIGYLRREFEPSPAPSDTEEQSYDMLDTNSHVLYSISDNESEIRQPMAARKKRSPKQKKARKSKKIDLTEMKADDESDDELHDENSDHSNLLAIDERRSNDDISGGRNRNTLPVLDSESEQEEDIRLVVSDDDDDGEDNEMNAVGSAGVHLHDDTASSKRGRSKISDLSSDEEAAVGNRKKQKQHRRAVISDDDDD